MSAPLSRAADDPLATTVLTVPGMHCAACMAKVERVLGAVPGVSAARVNLTSRQVRVEHRGALEPGDLVAALENAGFASQPRGDDMQPPASAARPLLAPLAVAGFACMNVMLLSVSIWSGADGATRDLFHRLSALIAVPAIAYAGRPFFVSALGALRRGQTNMDVPISIGVLLATGLSLYETAIRASDAWFDGTLMLLLFLLAGRVLDAAMRDRARAGVDALLRQSAPGAMILGDDGTLGWRPAGELVAGMIMRIAAGQRLAADGEILRGSSRFDRALLTGESRPVSAGPGEEVIAGTLNLEAPVDVRVSAAGPDTSLAEIARMMEAAQQSRSRYVRIADRASRLYAPLVHTLAALTLAGWLIAGAGAHQAIIVAVSVLIITCPCAIGLAVPTAQVVASGALMRAGIMVKDGSALERMARVDMAMIDKTGTLTLGRPVPDPVVIAALDRDEAAIALALASHSRHPLARGLAEALLEAGHVPAPLSEVAELAGHGIAGRFGKARVALRRPESASGMATALVIEGLPFRLIPFADALRPDAAPALDRLARLGIAARIVSGDSAEAVARVAQTTGLAAQAATSPEAKLAAIRAAQAGGHVVLMAGDGLNDGPALAGADASIAPGTASDVGRQAADMVFLGDSLLALPRAVETSRRTMRIVRENFVMAIGYNLLAVPLAVAGLITPLLAAAAMSTSSLLVIGNSLRLVRAAR